jgi:hypothetical protein
MKKVILAAALAASMGSLATTSFAESVACEDMLVKLNDALKAAKLSEADMKSVTDLKAKAEERCTAEDDKRSDGFVADALKIMGM